MTKNICEILDFLEEKFPQAHCELNYNTPYQLLIAVILSAQCTDKRVNKVTTELFKIAPDAKKMQNLGEERLKSIIKSCGFYNQKAKSIISCTNHLISEYQGEVPNDIRQLTNLRGVGRKTANVVLAECYKIPAIAVDTHVLRISKRLGLTSNKSTPIQCEKDLENKIDNVLYIKTHHQFIWFGRYFCKAINPNCNECKLKKICKYYKSKLSK